MVPNERVVDFRDNVRTGWTWAQTVRAPGKRGFASRFCISCGNEPTTQASHVAHRVPARLLDTERELKPLPNSTIPRRAGLTQERHRQPLTLQRERNVPGHLPERDRPPIKVRLRRAWAETDYHRALEQLRRLADELEHTHPGAAGSNRPHGIYAGAEAANVTAAGLQA